MWWLSRGCVSCVAVVAHWRTSCFAQPLFLFIFCNKQERKQRAELLEGLRSEMARLRQLHEVEVKALQAELDERLTLLQNRHREKVRRLPSSLWLGWGTVTPQCITLYSQGWHKRQVTISPYFFSPCSLWWQSSAW